MAEHQRAISLANKEAFLTSFKYKIDPSYHSVCRSSVSLVERFEFLILDSSNPKLFVKRRTLGPVLRYFLKSHVRTKLVKLRKLYSREIITLNQDTITSASNEVNKLRGIIRDIEKYVDTLPSPKKVIGSLAFLASLAAVIEFLGLRFSD